MTLLIDTAILALVAGNTLLAFYSPKKAVGLYALSALIFPHLRVFGPAVSYEIAAFIPVGFVCFYRSRYRIRPRLEYHLLAVYFIIAVAATVLSVARFGTSVLWIPILGWLRFLFLLVLFNEFVDRETIFKVLAVAITVNVIVAVPQLFVPGALEVSHQLYAKESQTVLDNYMEMGVIPRAPGTLGSPVNLGVLSLISFALAFERIMRSGYTLGRIFAAVVATSAGMLALSKTAILGIPLIFATGALLKFSSSLFQKIHISPKGLFTTLGLFSVGGVGMWQFITYLNESGFNIIRYTIFLQNPFRAFETRYSGTGNTTLDVTMEVVSANWLTGVGFTAPRGEFLGDSTYVLVLHAAGIFGAILVAALYASLGVRILRKNLAMLLVPLFALGATGFALPTLYTLIGVHVIAYIIVDARKSIFENRKAAQRNAIYR
jgi:hypothetical protein